MAMTITNDIEATPWAWLDAGLLHEACSGYRCRLVIGDRGGVVCDVVTGPRELDKQAVEDLATAAVVNTDPLGRGSLAIVDQAGRAARIVADSTHVVEVGALARQTTFTQDDMRVVTRLNINVVTLVTLAIILFGIAMMVGGVWIVGVFNVAVGTIGLATMYRKASDSKDEAGVGTARMREEERRERLPQTVTTS